MKKFIVLFAVIFSSCVQQTYVLKEGYALHRKEKVYTKFLFTAFPREDFTEEEEEICGKDYRLLNVVWMIDLGLLSFIPFFGLVYIEHYRYHCGIVK